MTIEEAIKVLEDRKTCVECVHASLKTGRFDHACDECAKAFEMAYAALRAQQERENQKPMTMDELLEMDGEPVWVDRPDGYKYYNGWALLDVSWKAKNVIYLIYPHGPSDVCEMLLKSGGKIYRRKPKEETT